MSAIFLFHRDLRVPDNTALHQALSVNDSSVLPVFIFPPEQIDPHKNKYFSNAAVQFMCESLVDLHGATNGHLALFHGATIDVLEKIHKHSPFTALYQNKDITAYAQQRDQKIEKWCKANGVEFINLEDYDLFPADVGLVPSSSKPYTILSQYYNRYLKDLVVPKPTKLSATLISRLVGPNAALKDLKEFVPVDEIKTSRFYTHDPNIQQKGGRRHASVRLRKLGSYKTYDKTRDFPANDDGTTKLSAYIKFGCVSIREVYWKCVDAFKTRDHPLIRELIFRSHYYKNYSHRMELQRGVAYLEHVDKGIPWSYDKRVFEAWKQGRTGFPLVDAGMRQLNTTHWMHNRVRMLVASVLSKYLLIDWREGERYFATQLVDYDPISNLAGWGFGSSTGFDNPQNITRAPMNPMIQSNKFDHNAEYIKKWVPELKDVPVADIHRWDEEKVRAKHPNCSYPAPIVDRKEASARAMKLWKAAATRKH